jgi:hypothetical protein
MATTKFTWGRKHTFIAAGAAVAVALGTSVYYNVVTVPAQNKAAQVAACQSFATVISKASDEADVIKGIELILDGAGAAAKFAVEGQDLKKSLLEINQLNFTAADYKDQSAGEDFANRIQHVGDLCSAEILGSSPTPSEG